MSITPVKPVAESSTWRHVLWLRVACMPGRQIDVEDQRVALERLRQSRPGVCVASIEEVAPASSLAAKAAGALR